MPKVFEINRIEDLAPYRSRWAELLKQTPGAAFFQSLEWLEAYWRHFGPGQKLRTMLVFSDDGVLSGIVPLTVRKENTKLGRFRVLTYPLHDWGSFYGPIGTDTSWALKAALEHVQRTNRDWDWLDLRWQGAPKTNPLEAAEAMEAAGLHCYQTLWDRTAIVELRGTWESYWASRKGSWRRRMKQALRKLKSLGEVSYVRYRPQEENLNEGESRWDLYDACEAIAQRSWQGASSTGTTLSHPSVRDFLREVHRAAVAAAAVDLNLLMRHGSPIAFIYGYCWQGRVFGLRRGYDPILAPPGAGNILLMYTIRDSFLRGDRYYDMGVGSLESKRHFLTHLLPILRYSHFPGGSIRVQLLRLRRWWQSRQWKAQGSNSGYSSI